MRTVERNTSLAVRVAAGAALLAWLAWWGYTLYENQIIEPVRLGYLTVLDVPPGGDFRQQIQAARQILASEDPWAPGTELGVYNYPPAALPFFLWTALLPPRAAIAVWMVAVIVVLAAAAVVACRHRAALGLEPLPLLPALAFFLWSSPTLFDVDRGQVDVVVLVLTYLGWRYTRRATAGGDVAAGLCLGTAIWVKLYPFLLVFGAAALPRRRVVFATLATIVLIGVGGWKWNLACFGANARIKMRSGPIQTLGLVLQGKWDEVQPDVTTWKHEFRAHEHSLSDYAQGLLCDLGLRGLAKVPGLFFGAALVLPLAAGLAWLQFRHGTPGTELPLLVFLTVLGTFVMPLAWDYTLCLLVLVILAVWSRRDPWPAQLCLLAFTLYLFPFRPEFRAQAHVLFQLKLLGLLGTAWMLARRIRESRPALKLP